LNLYCAYCFAFSLSLSQSCRSHLKNHAPLPHTGQGAAGVIRGSLKSIIVVRLFAPGAHCFIKIVVINWIVLLSRIVQLFSSRIALSSLSCIVSLVLSRGRVFASAFLTAARIAPSPSRVSSRLRLTRCLVFISHISRSFRFAYRLVFVSRAA